MGKESRRLYEENFMEEKIKIWDVSLIKSGYMLASLLACQLAAKDMSNYKT